MSFRKFGTPERIERPQDQDRPDADQQGINVTAARQEPGEQYSIEDIENEVPE